MVSVDSPPGRRELPFARTLLLPAILMAAATGAAVAVVAEPARLAVGLCGALATLLVIAAAAETARRGRALRVMRAEHARHSAYLERRAASHHEEMVRLGGEVLPDILDFMRNGSTPEEVMRRLGEVDPSYVELGEPQRKMIRMICDIVDHQDSMRESAERSFVDIARRVQAIVHQQNKELREMEEDHGRNPEVFDDLLRIDHGTALIGRLADSVSVIGGGRPGRQWPKPVALYSVLRGAMSRILQYRRINLASIAKVNIKGTAVEPVIHAAAELLDNATRYSPPGAKVHVTATEVQSGVCIEIEDAGVSLSEESRARIEGLLEHAKRGTDVQDLAHHPRLGLSVVGRLCTQFGMDVSLRASAYGGVRAILIVPSKMMTTEPGVGLAHGIGATSIPHPGPDALPGPERTPKKRRPTSPRIPDSVLLEDDVPEVTEWTAGGLPQRRSRVKMPLSQRLAEQAVWEREDAEREARLAAERARNGFPVAADPEPEPKKDEGLPPGHFIGAFWEGLKQHSGSDQAHQQSSGNEPAHAPADDEGDLK
ncbi:MULTISPECIES: sensor histidine kinase [unclassified Streptomyces]|uniref:sensor histidine kinase n=1 Tax=unclassified Streptomyces TaxID=2593676 RepID=UPI002442B33C|nr:ATP-binding protein [Streptomyces sp. DH41]MDG9727293.1 ATP-binding protein [Streptomyces sp. DH41]